MSKYLIILGTEEGQTANIADKLGEVMCQRGYQADVYESREVPITFHFDGYTGALVGSSIHPRPLFSSSADTKVKSTKFPQSSPLV